MTLTISPLDEATAPLLRELLPTVWGLDRDSRFLSELFRWRYLERPAGDQTLVAIDRTRCVGVIDAMLRSYQIGGERITVRETADWFCLPEYRAAGLGLRMMRAMMRQPEPIVVVGGTEATRSILPRLGWTEMGQAMQMILPVKLRGLTGYLLRLHGHAERAIYARAIPCLVPCRSARKAKPPAGDAAVAEWFPGGRLPLPEPCDLGITGLLEPATVDWFYAAPHDLLQPMLLVFRLGGKPAAVSLSQLEPSSIGAQARIVQLQFAAPSADVIEWVLSETARRLTARGANFIRCRASNPALIERLHRCRFMAAGAEPVFWWPGGHKLPEGHVAVNYLRGDDAVPLDAARTFNPRPPLFKRGPSRRGRAAEQLFET